MGACIRRLRPDAALVLIQEILKLDTTTRVGRRIHVGDVMRNDLNIELLSEHSGRAYTNPDYSRHGVKEVVSVD